MSITKIHFSININLILDFFFYICINSYMRTFIDQLHTLYTGSEIEMEPFLVKIETLLKTMKEDMIASFQDKQNTFTSIASHQKKRFKLL